jgi:hypothetical protein
VDGDLTRLGHLLPVMEDPSFVAGTWVDGNRLPNGVIQMGYFDLSPAAMEIVRALPVEEFDWPEWMRTEEAQSLLRDHGKIAFASFAQLVNLSTSLVRGDRFNDGLLAESFESGLIQAIVRRAAALTASDADA